jgi:hypothetical protein
VGAVDETGAVWACAGADTPDHEPAATTARATRRRWLNRDTRTIDIIVASVRRPTQTPLLLTDRTLRVVFMW